MSETKTEYHPSAFELLLEWARERGIIKQEKAKEEAKDGKSTA